MIPHEKANSFLEIVYRDGLARSKAVLSEQVKTGDKTARRILNAVGLYENGEHGVREPIWENTKSELSYTPVELAEQIRFVMESREKAITLDHMVTELLRSSLPVETAIQTLL